jgi:hypothetical protein
MTLKNLKKKVSDHLPEILGGVALATVATVGVIVCVKFFRAPVFPKGLNDAIPVDLSSVLELDHLKSMIENCSQASIIHVTEGAILFLEK